MTSEEVSAKIPVKSNENRHPAVKWPSSSQKNHAQPLTASCQSHSITQNTHITTDAYDIFKSYRTKHAADLPMFRVAGKCDMPLSALSFLYFISLADRQTETIQATERSWAFDCFIVLGVAFYVVMWLSFYFGQYEWLWLWCQYWCHHIHHPFGQYIFVAQLYQNFTKTDCEFLLIICNYQPVCVYLFFFFIVSFAWIRLGGQFVQWN